MFKLSSQILEEQKLSFGEHKEDEILEVIETSKDTPIDAEDEDHDDFEDFPIKVKEDLPSKEDFSTKSKKKRKSELEKLKIDMKGWNYFAIVKQNSQDEDQEIPEDQKLSRSFQEALRCCREALLKMGFIYTLVKTETKAFTIQQEIPLALQAVVESTSLFNKDSQDNQNNMPKNQFVMCGHVGVDREIGDGGRFGEMADDLFNDVIFDDDIFDDMNIFLI